MGFVVLLLILILATVLAGPIGFVVAAVSILTWAVITGSLRLLWAVLTLPFRLLTGRSRHELDGGWRRS